MHGFYPCISLVIHGYKTDFIPGKAFAPRDVLTSYLSYIKNINREKTYSKYSQEHFNSSEKAIIPRDVLTSYLSYIKNINREF